MRTAIPILAVAVFAGLARADASCPLNYIQCNTHEYSSYAPSYSLYCPQEFEQTGQSSVSYDLVSGLFTSTAEGQEYGAGSYATAFDHYEIKGMDSTCGVTIRAEMHIHFRYDRSRALGAGADVAARLVDLSGNGPPEFYQLVHVSTVTDTVISMTIDPCSGHFDLHYEFGVGGGWGFVSGTAQIAFSGLPPGTAITSCQGFHTEQPIATLPMTWGRLRARYR